MGQVYLAEQLSLKRNVALKILKADITTNPTALQRFKVEAEAVARATHANIVQVYVFAEAEGLHYMALEYVEGRNLREFIARKGPPEILLALSIMRQVAAALQRAAELGIIHRDIKPENILLTRKGEVKVADFGLSRSLTGDAVPLNITQSGVVMGTPLYMSPEQVEGKTVDARTDIYSFGVTCYHIMAGHPPFEGNGAFDVALKHVRDEPLPLQTVRPDLPEGFCAVIHKMMAKQPDQRYQSCRELLRDLALVRESVAGVTGTVGRPGVSVELVPLPAAITPPGTLSVTSVSPTALAAVPGAASPQKGSVSTGPSRWAWTLAALTVLLALGGGLLTAGWSRLVPAAPTRPASRTPPPDAQEVDAICFDKSPEKREKVLREAIEMYLSGATYAPMKGLPMCLDLGVFYLEHDRLDDADRFFTRLESIKAPYPTLGKLGRGIVLALRSQPAESNKLFQEVFRDTPLKDSPRLPNAGSPAVSQSPEFAVWRQNALFRFWFAQALYFNEKNGQPLKDVPDWVNRFYKNLPNAPK
jgi:serine/threonine-protein kinase